MSQGSDFVSLVQRLLDLLSKLFTERVELAKNELQAGARRASRRAALAFAGGLFFAVGIAFAGAAAAEALAPLIHNLALRLLLIALPLVMVGAWLVARASSDRLAGPLTDDRDHDGQEREHQEHVRPGAERIAADQPR